MELHVYLAFVLATSIMIAMPGPSVILTVAHSISFGWRNSLSTVLGETMGVGVQLLIAAIGLSSLLHLISAAFSWLRWFGAIYLVYLGIKRWRSADIAVTVDTSSVSRKNLFLQGLIVTIPNPKSLIFIAAFLPQFIDPARSISLQFSLIVPTFLLITFTVTSVWACIAEYAREYLSRKQAMKTVFRATGGLMIVSGVGLAMARRGN